MVLHPRSRRHWERRMRCLAVLPSRSERHKAIQPGESPRYAALPAPCRAGRSTHSSPVRGWCRCGCSARRRAPRRCGRAGRCGPDDRDGTCSCPPSSGGGRWGTTAPLRAAGTGETGRSVRRGAATAWAWPYPRTDLRTHRGAARCCAQGHEGHRLGPAVERSASRVMPGGLAGGGERTQGACCQGSDRPQPLHPQVLGAVVAIAVSTAGPARPLRRQVSGKRAEPARREGAQIGSPQHSGVAGARLPPFGVSPPLPGSEGGGASSRWAESRVGCRRSGVCECPPPPPRGHIDGVVGPCFVSAFCRCVFHTPSRVVPASHSLFEGTCL